MALHQPHQLIFEGAIAALWMFGMVGMTAGYHRNLRLWDINLRTVAELRASEERYRLISENAGDVIWLLDAATGRFTFVSPSVERVLGYRPDELLGRTLAEFLSPESCGKAQAQLPSRMASLERGGPATRSEFMVLDHVHKDGTRLPMEVRSTLLPGGKEGTLALLGVSHDVTERQKAEDLRQHMEAQLAHAQKMESLGTLASGVAHDMNNVLMAILGMTEVLRHEGAQSPAVNHAAEIIARAGERGRDLVRNLTRFVRKEVHESKPLDINRMICEDAALLDRTLLQKVGVRLDLEEGLPRVLGDASALSSAVMNLCVNAVDAMPEGGILTVRTRRVADQQIALEVEDTGTGMPPEVIKRAVEPFYTTKPPGKGTGLGLSMAYTTAQAHGGALKIKSAPGEGTIVSLVLPALEEAQQEPSQPPSALGSQRRTILLVDDEDLIRAAIGQMLQALGHTVVMAACADAALDLIQGGVLPDLIVLDLNMPVLGGLEMLRRLRNLHLQLPVLVSTGYLDGEAEGILERDPHAHFIRKPYGMEDLRQALLVLASSASSNSR